MSLPLSSYGTIAPAPKREAKEYIEVNGKPSEPLFIFVNFSDSPECKCLAMTAPAKDAVDFETRYYSQIIY
jgi:hypothetical protein